MVLQPASKAGAAAPPTELTGCCPPFDPSTWRHGTLAWQDKLFVTDHVHCILHVPIDMRQRMAKNDRLIETAGARPARPLTLCTDTSAWGTDLFIEVTCPVPGARMARLSGTFSTKVYEGPYKDAGKWVADMRQLMAQQGHTIEKVYLGFTTCPRCAKAYGKNYVIVFAQHASTARTIHVA